jgi:hypothetical protein
MIYHEHLKQAVIRIKVFPSYGIDETPFGRYLRAILVDVENIFTANDQVHKEAWAYFFGVFYPQTINAVDIRFWGLSDLESTLKIIPETHWQSISALMVMKIPRGAFGLLDCFSRLMRAIVTTKETQDTSKQSYDAVEFSALVEAIAKVSSKTTLKINEKNVVEETHLMKFGVAYHSGRSFSLTYKEESNTFDDLLEKPGEFERMRGGSQFNRDFLWVADFRCNMPFSKELMRNWRLRC